MTDRPVLELRIGDVVRLRRSHPCGAAEWTVDRLGADIGLRCRGCSRRVMLERRAVERRLDGFVERGQEPVFGHETESRPEPASGLDRRHGPDVVPESGSRA